MGRVRKRDVGSGQFINILVDRNNGLTKGRGRARKHRESGWAGQIQRGDESGQERRFDLTGRAWLELMGRAGSGQIKKRGDYHCEIVGAVVQTLVSLKSKLISLVYQAKNNGILRFHGKCQTLRRMPRV